MNLIGRFFKLSIIFLAIFACSDVQDIEVPERLLSEDEMVEVYTDMMIIDAINRTNAKIYNEFDIDINEHMLNKYNIDSTILVNNIVYYNLDFDANVRIFERVNENILGKKDYFDSINSRTDSLEKLKKEKKRDSIKNSLKKKEILKSDTISKIDSSKTLKSIREKSMIRSIKKQN